ncbi:unnamed protein product [Adineta steineri]|uniref:G-protein coupled receptors family 1 profile domain-containing protein n=1 Tax=Adineta steineri TaxID=433720 RepID=A0A814NZ33_9BILA|nr:unnamed protein product [Adineta steineri]
MSADTDQHRPSFRFRDKFSRLKDRVKDKIKDKAIKHNVTLFIHQNITTTTTTNNSHEDHNDNSRHGFRQHMHHMKDVLKNKTHYESIKDKVKHKIDDKLDLYDNKTYPKGFYDSLFSPETENDVYLQTALICLWVIALLCLIPTIIVIFLPAKKKRGSTSTNMIFFHIFLCELCYLTYILLAMINVAKDFHMASFFCDIANYGMYVTIPIMQFALFFLSLERLSKHFNLPMTWARIFTKPYLIQVILWVIWIVLIALLVTFMFIRKQFSFNLIKDKAYSLAPPILGDVVSRLASRRYHCSIDGRLSSVFKTLIIILFVILIVKPIIFSIGFNLCTPYCCKKQRRDLESHGDRRTTTLVTIFLLLNLFFSFPFYFVSMFNSILTRIDSTKDVFTIILKICFILRITNIIFECLAFYIFERNSWDLLSKLFYYGTCKKCPIFKVSEDDDDRMYTKDPQVQKLIDRTRANKAVDDDDDGETTTKKKRITKKKREQVIEVEPDDDNDDDDGGFRKAKKKPSITRENEIQAESDDDDDDDDAKPVIKRTKQSSKKIVQSGDEENETKKVYTKKRTSKTKVVDSDEDEDEDEPEQVHTTKRKSQIIRKETVTDDEEEEEEDEKNDTKRKPRKTKHISDDEEEEQEIKTTTRRKSRTKQPESDNEEEEEEQEIKTTTRRKSRTKQPESDNEEEEEKPIKRKSRPKIDKEQEITRKPKSKPRQKVEVEEEEEMVKIPKKKSHHTNVEIQIPNGKSTSHRSVPPTTTSKPTKSAQKHPTSSHRITERRATQPSQDELSDASHSSAKMIDSSAKPVKKRPTKVHTSSTEQKQSRTKSPNEKRSHHRTEPSTTSHHRCANSE